MHEWSIEMHLWSRGHHACLSSWETQVQSLVGPLLKVLKLLSIEKNTDVKDTDSKVAESL